jgi:hypothetical protein
MMVMVVATATSVAAQLPQVGVPRGHIRLEVGADFTTVNGEFFGGLQPFRNDWNAEIGSAFLPELADADARIRALTGDASYRLSAGRSSVVASTQTGSAVLSAAIGVTSRLTLFGTMPFVRARSQSNLRVDSTSADAGFNPFDAAFGTSAGRTQTNLFFTQFDAALLTLATNITNGVYTDPDTLALAQATLASATAFRGDLNGLLRDGTTASPFVPLASSTAGTAILGSVNGYSATFTALGAGSVATPPALATARLSSDQYRGFITDAFGPVGAFMDGDQRLQRPGDTEVGVVYTMVDRWGERRPAFRLALTGLVRLPTGLLDQSDDFFDLGTGEGQTDLEFRAAADFAAGIVGGRLSGSYNRQMASELQRRVYAPSQPLAYRYRLATVERDPGDEFTLGFEPWLRLAPGFAATFGAFYVKHGEDAVSYPGSAVPGVAASDLAIDTDRSATALQGGLTYSSFSGVQKPGVPMEARWAFRQVVAGSGGRVERTRTMWFQVRAYYKLW